MSLWGKTSSIMSILMTSALTEANYISTTKASSVFTKNIASYLERKGKLYLKTGDGVFIDV